MKKTVAFLLTALMLLGLVPASVFGAFAEECSHYYSTSITKPTCNDEGYTTYTCVDCGDSYKDDYVPAKGHSYSEVVTAPTCNDRGFTTHTCVDCGDSYVDSPVDAKGHSYSSTVVQPDCDDKGYTLHTCSDCGYSYKDNYVLENGHSYESKVTEPTCTKRGYTTHTCTVCGKSYVDSYVPANGHTGGADATCETDQTCIICGEVITDKLGHSYSAVVTAPTCTAQGYTTHTCSRCGDSYVDSYVPANGHTPGKAATCITDQTCEICGTVLKGALGHFYETSVANATCTDEGFLLHTCMDCGHSYKDNFVPANGHTGGAEATCTTDQTCTVCGAVVVERLGHNYIAVVTEPTCEEQGYTTHTCSRCGDSYVDSYVKANGHTPGAEATCTTDQTCIDCGEILKNKLGHYYELSVSAPTCTEQGYTIYTCIDCGHSYNDSFVRPYGHDYVSTVTSPTCEDKGYTTHTCSFCGDSYDDTFVPAKGHNYSSVVTEPTCEEQGYTTHTCPDCGDRYDDSFTDPKGHGEGEWIAIEEEGEDPVDGLCCPDCGEIIDTRTTVPYLLGDVDLNGVIDKLDYSAIKRYCFGTVLFGEVEMLVADVNLDGEIGKEDYLLVKRFCFETAIIDPKYIDIPLSLLR